MVLDSTVAGKEGVMTKRLVFTAIVLSILMIGFGQAKDSLEYQLAVINAGGYVAQDDVTVARFRYLLKTISSKTVNSRQQISDMTVKGQQILRDEYGQRIKLLDLMEGANKAISSGQKLEYSEVVSVLIILLRD